MYKIIWEHPLISKENYGSLQRLCQKDAETKLSRLSWDKIGHI